MLSYGLTDKIENVDTVSGIKSDHSALTLSLVILLHLKGPSYWKLNCSYLKDLDFIAGVTKNILDTVEFNQSTSCMLLWDTIKCQVRGFSLKYSAQKKKIKINIIAALEKLLQRLENTLTEARCTEIEEQISQIQEELDKYIGDKTKGAMIRVELDGLRRGRNLQSIF